MPPYLNQGEMSVPIFHNDGSISINTLTREFTLMFSINMVDFGIIDFYFDDHKVRLIGLDSTVGNSSRVKPIFSLYFKPKSFAQSVIDTNTIQVNNVYLDRDLRSKQIASQVYFQLAKLGYTIISDTVQFETAQGLWKKIASESSKHGCVVYAADTDHGIFKDADGNKIVYNGTNIKDHEIWTSGSDFDGNYRVLILTSHY